MIRHFQQLFCILITSFSLTNCGSSSQTPGSEPLQKFEISDNNFEHAKAAYDESIVGMPANEVVKHRREVIQNSRANSALKRVLLDSICNDNPIIEDDLDLIADIASNFENEWSLRIQSYNAIEAAAKIGGGALNRIIDWLDSTKADYKPSRSEISIRILKANTELAVRVPFNERPPEVENAILENQKYSNAIVDRDLRMAVKNWRTDPATHDRELNYILRYPTEYALSDVYYYKWNKDQSDTALIHICGLMELGHFPDDSQTEKILKPIAEILPFQKRSDYFSELMKAANSGYNKTPLDNESLADSELSHFYVAVFKSFLENWKNLEVSDAFLSNLMNFLEYLGSSSTNVRQAFFEAGLLRNLPRLTETDTDETPSVIAVKEILEILSKEKIYRDSSVTVAMIDFADQPAYRYSALVVLAKMALVKKSSWISENSLTRRMAQEFFLDLENSQEVLSKWDLNDVDYVHSIVKKVKANKE
jgi:hypothetical protein